MEQSIRVANKVASLVGNEYVAILSLERHFAFKNHIKVLSKVIVPVDGVILAIMDNLGKHY